MLFIDSHTGGEPTRVILDGGPPLGGNSLSERRVRFALRYDRFRLTVVGEPRGVPAMVGALLCEPVDSSCAAGVIFFNAGGFLGMCGHAMMGLAVSLYHLGRIGLGRHLIETPVGLVAVKISSPVEVQIENVESYRYRKDVCVDVDGVGKVTGDVAWGGNWFFLAKTAPHPVRAEFIPQLLKAASRVKDALAVNRITGENGEAIDHVEFFGPPSGSALDSRNFVLCPDDNFDRSPCRTGTSAKLACLAEDGSLQPDQIWVQESILGSRFEAHYRAGECGGIVPSIRGRAYITAEGRLHCAPSDPFANGIRPAA